MALHKYRRNFFLIAAVALVAGLALYWRGGTPRTGNRPQFPMVALVSVEVSVSDQSVTTITNAAALESVIAMLRSGRSVVSHECKSRGLMVLHFANGESLRVSFLPGHHFLRYEFGFGGQLFAVSRGRFIEALTAAGVDAHRIPKR